MAWAAAKPLRENPDRWAEIYPWAPCRLLFRPIDSKLQKKVFAIAGGPLKTGWAPVLRTPCPLSTALGSSFALIRVCLLSIT